MSELALTLIAENKKTRSPFLDPGICGLTQVPEGIGELVWLEEFSFAKPISAERSEAHRSRLMCPVAMAHNGQH